MPAARSDGEGAPHPGAPTTEPRTASRRPPRLISDRTRYGWSVLVTIAAGVVLGLVVVREPASGALWSLQAVVVVYLGAWSVYATVYSALVWVAFRAADGRTLRAWLTEDSTTRRRRRLSEWLVGTGGPWGAVSFCLFAVGAVVAATVVPELRSSPIVVGLAVAVVASSWFLIATAFALHYAREDARLRELRFPESDARGLPRFADYWYVSVQVGAAYGSSDVMVAGRALRRSVTAHALVALVFNSVLVALLVSLFIAASTSGG